MAASTLDKFTDTYNAANPNVARVTATRAAAGNSLSCDNLAGWPTASKVHFSTYQINTSNAVVAGTQIDWQGIVSGNTIGSLTRITGATDNGSAVGDVVEMNPTASWGHDLYSGLTTSHNNDGTMITGLPLTTPKITTGLKDANGATWIGQTATTSAVNYVNNTNAATGGSPVIAAAGSDAAVNLNLRGKGLAKTVTIGAGAATIFPYDFVLSGCVWTADAAGSTRLASMTSGVVVINGNPVTVAAVTSRTFTASKDVYVDVLDNGDGTGLLVYTDNTTNAASPALASNSVRIAIVVVGATNIAASTSINQGQVGRALPIASSIPYETTDSLGNLICPRDPNRTTLGYISLGALSTSSTSDVQVTGSIVTVNIPSSMAGRRARLSTSNLTLANTTGSLYVTPALYSGTTVGGGTMLTRSYSVIPNASGLETTKLETDVNLTTGTMNFFLAAGVQGGTGGINHYGGEHIKVELV